ncbi:MAG: flagellar motor switch protein FliN [Nitrospirales bacterium]
MSENPEEGQGTPAEEDDMDMDVEAAMAAALADEAASNPPAQAVSAPPPADPPSVPQPTLGVSGDASGSQEWDLSLDRIMDIPLVISAQLGSAKMVIKELLQLGPGSVVELDKLAGEPLEVLVNEKLVARGEVVMVNEKFGIRLTDVVSQSERVNKLA